MSQILYFAAIKLTVPGIMVPSCLITLSNYLLFDLEDESFFLPFPVACVIFSGF